MQYERLQKTGVRYTLRTCVANSLRMRRDDTVLKLLTSTDGATFGLTAPPFCQIGEDRAEATKDRSVDATPTILRNEN